MGTEIYNEPSFLRVVTSTWQGCFQTKIELYELISPGMRYLIRRKVEPNQVEDVFQAAFTTVVDAIQSEQITRPERLMAYARLAINRVVGSLEVDVPCKVALNTGSENTQAQEYMRRSFQKLTHLEREILHRFYVLEQSKEQICRELKLDGTLYSVVKFQAKAKLTLSARFARKITGQKVLMNPG